MVLASEAEVKWRDGGADSRWRGTNAPRGTFLRGVGGCARVATGLEFAEKKRRLEKNFANRFILEWIDFSAFLPAFFESKQSSKKQGIEFSAPLISIFQLDRFA